MTRDEYIDKYRKELMGFVSEAWCVRNEPPSRVGLVFDRMHSRARQLLAEMWADFQPPPEASAKVPAANGQHVNGNGRRA